jgi:hypothetical protein
MDDESPNEASPVAGKLLIVSMLVVSVSLAAFSWWFRYSSTRRAAQFWRADAVRLIRDAPTLDAYRWTAAGESELEQVDLEYVNALGRPALHRDAAHAPGLTHLRAALLEDRSYDWDADVELAVGEAAFGLRFTGAEGGEPLWLLFSANGERMGLVDGRVVSTEPIAEGLREVLGELIGDEVRR